MASSPPFLFFSGAPDAEPVGTGEVLLEALDEASTDALGMGDESPGFGDGGLLVASVALSREGMSTKDQSDETIIETTAGTRTLQITLPRSHASRGRSGAGSVAASANQEFEASVGSCMVGETRCAP